MQGEARLGEVRIGPAGWSYADWKGIVYPADMPRGRHALELLSDWFDMAEINVSFYRPVTAGMARSWLGKVSGNTAFRFTAKVWRRFTHDDVNGIDGEEVRTFRAGIDPLMESGRLGALLLQYPWSFRRTAENRRQLARTIGALDGYPLAVEVRHDSWQCAEFLEGLRERGVAVCNIDQPAHRHGIAPTADVTSALGYVRLHGRNAKAWFNDKLPSYERYNYLYSPNELQPWVDRIGSIRERTEETYVVANNHYQGKAVANALELSIALGRMPGTLPEGLLTAYPRLRSLLEGEAREAPSRGGVS